MPADRPRPAAGVNEHVLAGLEARLASARGAVIGTSGPLRISPPEEDAFAALIGDWDPMHNDPAWQTAAGDGPIVLGFHVLARTGVQTRRPGDHLVSTRHVLEAEGNDLAVLVADCKTLYRTSS